MKVFRMILVTAAAAALTAGSAVPSAATSCATDPGATPQKLLAGRQVHRKPFFARFDLAVVGTVTAIRTNEAPGPDYGLTRTTVDVHTAFNVAELPHTIDVSSPDPGWVSGYNFQHGVTYFIPLKHPGLNGQPYYSSLCNPITHLEGPAAVAELEQIAADNGVTIAREVAAVPSDADEGGMPVLGVIAIVGLALMALLAVVGVSMVAGRRRGGGWSRRA